MHGPTLLVVDDDDDVRELAVAFFADDGYRVIPASDARSALDVRAWRQEANDRACCWCGSRSGTWVSDAPPKPATAIRAPYARLPARPRAEAGGVLSSVRPWRGTRSGATRGTSRPLRRSASALESTAMHPMRLASGDCAAPLHLRSAARRLQLRAEIARIVHVAEKTLVIQCPC
jgi:hypothetical protein